MRGNKIDFAILLVIYCDRSFDDLSDPAVNLGHT